MKPGASSTGRGSAASRRLAASVLIVVAAMAPHGAAAQERTNPNVKDLAGDWTVDLRPTSDSPELVKSMRIDVAPDNTISGTFYDSAIETGRADASKARACFAFTTSDGTGPYQTAGCLVGERIEWQTWSPARGFLITWTAVRPAR